MLRLFYLLLVKNNNWNLLLGTMGNFLRYYLVSAKLTPKFLPTYITHYDSFKLSNHQF